MIWYYIILFVTSLLNEVFSWLDKVQTLPTILGVDIDSNLTNGVGMIYAMSSTFWFIGDVMKALLVVLGYYAIKIALRVVLGSRAPLS